MLTADENMAMTAVGPGTPVGELMRRYWQPIAGISELDDEQKLSVRLLGEDLVLYRDKGGHLGLLDHSCAHRGLSLMYGMLEENGIRCPYHGWLYNNAGALIETPAEAPTSRFKDKICLKSYPVQVLGGLVFAYLGPSPAPLLPNFDVFVWEDSWRDIGKAILPCNWLQCVENFTDLFHVDYLHGMYYDYVLAEQGKPPRNKSDRVYNGVKQVEMGFEVFEFGIKKRRRLAGMEDNPEWAEGGNPALFPNFMRAGGRGVMQMAIPIDDTHTLALIYTCYRPDDGLPVPPQQRIPVYDVPLYDEKGRHVTDWVTGQDIMAWVNQGPVTDRTKEHLCASDEGIMLYRKLLMEQTERVKAGEDPLGTIRDPDKNGIILLQNEDGPAASARFMDNHANRYSPIFADAKALLERHKTVEVHAT